MANDLKQRKNIYAIIKKGNMFLYVIRNTLKKFSLAFFARVNETY